MDTTYVISVDALDLSLLPFTYQPRRNITPLWNRNNELSEFNIHIRNTSPSEQSVTEKLPPRTQAIETIMCHMCKVDVPKQFFKEHKNSPKHNTFTKIANLALQRITKHLNDGCDYDETEVDKLTYFCDHCVAVVKISEKKTHENSHSHKNSVFLDKCLSDFLDLYINVDKIDNNDKDSNTLDTSSSQNNGNKDNKFDLKKYLDILKNKYKMSMKIKVIDEGRFEIVVDGSTVEVAAENFHGLKKTSNDNLECIVCKEAVKVRDKVEHIMSAKHMHRVSTPFKDIHCKREIYPSWHHCVLCNVITDNTNLHTISDPGHHRLLQEALKYKSPDNSTENSLSSENWTLVTNKTNKTDASTNNDSSLNKYSDLLDTDTSMASKEDLSPANKTFCSHCNVYIVTKNLKKHINTKKHLCNTISKFYYLFKLDMDITRCRVCDVIVNSVDDFEKHVNFSEHINKYNALLATNKIRKMDKHNFFCGSCDKLVLVKNELCHIKESDHVQFLDSNKDLSPTSDYHCDVCDVNVINTVRDIQLHNEGISHNLKKCSLRDSPSSIKSNSYYYNYTMVETQSPNFVNCSVCNILVPKDEELVQKHIESENHTGKYEKLLQDHRLVLQNDDIYCYICKVFVGLNSEIMHARGKRHLKNLNKTEEKFVKPVCLSGEDNAKLEAQVKVFASGVTVNKADLDVITEFFDVSDNMKELICKTCKVSVPFTAYNSRGHLEGSKHKQKLMDLEIMNSESTS